MKQFTFLGGFLLCAVLFWGCQSPGGETAAPRTDTVFLTGMQFHPHTLAVNVGDTVIWINKGIVKHNVTAYPDSAWTSGKIAVGQSWKKVIKDSFPYFCSIHPTMKGQIALKK